MNTPVSFDLAKLLKEKGWQIPTLYYYFEDGVLIQNTIKDTVGMDYGSEFEVEFSEFTENWNDNFLTRKNGDRCFGCSKSQGYFETFSAPSISEVVMWLYEKNGIWVHAMKSFNDFTPYIQCDWNYRKDSITGVLEFMQKRFNSPTETYEAALEYCITKIIP